MNTPANNDVVTDVIPKTAATDAAVADIGPMPESTTAHLGAAPANHVWFGTGLWQAISNHIGQLPYQLVHSYRTVVRDIFKSNNIDLANQQSVANAPTHVAVPVALINQVMAFLQTRPFDEVESLLANAAQHLQGLAKEAEAMFKWNTAKAQAELNAATADAAAAAQTPPAEVITAEVAPASPAAPEVPAPTAAETATAAPEATQIAE